MGAFGFQPHGGSLRRQAEGLNKRLGPRKFDLRSNAAGCRHAAKRPNAFALGDTAAAQDGRLFEALKLKPAKKTDADWISNQRP